LKIITGNPGTGKHTIASLIAKKMGLELIDINKVVIEEKTFERKDKTLNVDVQKLKRVLAKKRLKNSLLVGHLAPYVVSRNKVEIAVVLRRSPYELVQVYKKRRYDKVKQFENLGSEILGITYYDTIKNVGQDKTFQFDTTNKSIATITKKIELIFRKGKTKGEEIDWLALILKKGDLSRFFPY
jgi:adenylate kinase